VRDSPANTDSPSPSWCVLTNAPRRGIVQRAARPSVCPRRRVAAALRPGPWAGAWCRLPRVAATAIRPGRNSGASPSAPSSLGPVSVFVASTGLAVVAAACVTDGHHGPPRAARACRNDLRCRVGCIVCTTICTRQQSGKNAPNSFRMQWGFSRLRPGADRSGRATSVAANEPCRFLHSRIGASAPAWTRRHESAGGS